MKIYNRGGRLFSHHELRIKADSFTEIPDVHVEAVKKLLKDYPNELITAEDAESSANKLAKTVDEQRARIAELADTNARLVRDGLSAEDRDTTEKLTTDLTVANKTIADLRTEINTAVERCRELERSGTSLTDEVAAIKQELAAASASNMKLNGQVRDLESDLSNARARKK